MKILLFHNEGLNEGQIRDEYHIAEALKELGHEVFQNDETHLNWADLILTFKSNAIGVEQIRRWKQFAPVWVWTFDNMSRFPWFYDIAKECNLWLGEELGQAEEFKQKGIPFYYFPNHSAPPRYFHPIDTPKEYDVMFSGTPYFPERTAMLTAVRDAGIDLHIFGNRNFEGFNNHGPAFDEKLAEAVSKSKIVIGISNANIYGYWSIRPAQVMLCGGFMIDKYVLGMERELKDGCEYWNTHEELISKIKYYLEHEEERNAIAKKGYEIATTQLTNKQRCAELIKLFQNVKTI